MLHKVAVNDSQLSKVAVADAQLLAAAPVQLLVKVVMIFEKCSI